MAASRLLQMFDRFRYPARRRQSSPIDEGGFRLDAVEPLWERLARGYTNKWALLIPVNP
jgi:hypothetical protein